MSSSAVALVAQFVIHFLSVVTNIFGVYCLRKQRRKQKTSHRVEGHSLLMQNLAAIEIVKMSYEIFPLATFHYYAHWYYYFYLYYYFTM